MPRTRLLAFACLFATPALLSAHWISLTGAETASTVAEIHVLDDHVKVVLEISLADLDHFEELLPDPWIAEPGVERPTRAERLWRYSQGTLQFITEHGKKLAAELTTIERRPRKDRRGAPLGGAVDPFTGERTAESPERVAYAELTYSFEEQPRELTIVPPLDNEDRARVTIGFIAYHKGVPIIDFRRLARSERLKLDWEDPWRSAFENPELTRHHKSALMSYLSIESHEIRHEILTRVKDMEHWMELGLRGDRFVEVDELEPLKERIGAFLLKKNPLRTDGVLTKPILDRVSFVRVETAGLQTIEEDQRLELSTALLGVVIAYAVDLPEAISVDWELFTDEIQEVSAVTTDPAGRRESTLKPLDREHTWRNELGNERVPTVESVAVDEALKRTELPLGSIVCLAGLVIAAWQFRAQRKAARSIRAPVTLAVLSVAGCVVLYPFARITVAEPALSDDGATAILKSLLRNVYRAFDFRAEEDVYDKLALTVSGDLLEKVYLQSRTSLELKKAGGAQARVQRVEILDAKVERPDSAPPAYVLKARWTVLGAVGHWGHIHLRKNLYDAVVTIEALDGKWKMVGLEVLEEKRIDP